MATLAQRLDRLTAALVAADPSGGPARRTAADYAALKPAGKSGRKVATKAGEKRYGLPIGTPLGQTGSRRKNDAVTQRSYNTFMAAKTPAELNKAASWMSSDDLKRAGEALFSFDSKNERDAAARISLVKELAARGIDPHAVGYKGGPVVLNPHPKKDPHEQAADRRKTAKDKAARSRQQAADKAQREKDRATKAKTAQQAADADVKFRQQAGEALAQGLASDKQLSEAWRNRRKPQPVG